MFIRIETRSYITTNYIEVDLNTIQSNCQHGPFGYVAFVLCSHLYLS